MEKVEGIDLRQELDIVKFERLSEVREAVKKKINGIHNDIVKWIAEAKKAEETLARCTQRIKTAEESLSKISQGDWSPIKLDDQKEEVKNGASA